MTNEEKIMDAQTKPSKKMDECIRDEKGVGFLVDSGMVELDSDHIGRELISAQSYELEEIVENALSNWSVHDLLELCDSIGLDSAEEVMNSLGDFKQKSQATGDWLQVLCIYCEQVIADGLEEELRVYTTLPGSSVDKVTIWSCNRCASSKTFRDFEIRFLVKQLPYTLLGKDGENGLVEHQV